jgi:putative spermidine/putrescine transport system ATP-binding protein
MTTTGDGPAPRGRIQLDRISVNYGAVNVVRDISLDISPGEFVCLLGPSGCGKTTTLRAIAGLAAIDSGSLLIDGKIANHLPAHQREIAMVFQDLALFPHMTVRRNVSFGLRLRRLDSGKIDAEVSSILKMLHLEELHDRLPSELSGGQQQRVAIARSLVVHPSVLLLDEPFAALDRKLREEMRYEIRALQRRLRITVVFVTHDQEEALTMSDRVVVMNQGRLEQVGTPTEIYERPASRFVSGFVGFSNFLAVDLVTRSSTEVRCRLAGQEIFLSTRTIPGNPSGIPLEMAIRSERIRLATEGGPSLRNRLAATVHDLAYEGASITYRLALDDGQILIVREQNDGSMSAPGQRRRYGVGDTVVVEWESNDAVLVGGAA